MFRFARSPCARRFPKARTSPRKGFALLLVVVVLGFLAVVVIALATQLRIEQALAQRRLQIEQARRHALTGLSLALGQLQTEAGLDRRAVASAAMAGPVAANKAHWSGVWLPGPDGPRWLVSSADPARTNPEIADWADPVVLVGPASADVTAPETADPDQVRVEAIPLTVPAASYPGWTESADPVIGRTAYWVGDETGKISILPRDERSALTGGAPPDPWPRMDLASWWGGFDLHAPAAQALLARVLTYGQLGYVDGTAFSPARLRRNFHRATVSSSAVLSRAETGGLKVPGIVEGNAAYGTPDAPRYDAQYYAVNPPAGTDPDRLPAARFGVHRPLGVDPAGADLAGPTAAAWLFVSGAFNLNAVSDDAAIQRERWRAVLSAARNLRFPEGTVRTLSNGELDALAAQMTAARFRAAYPSAGKAAGAPFLSVDGFARSGLLQAAIDASVLNQGRTAESADRVDQTDLLALLAPVLVTRSDTFLVRAYGEVRDPFAREARGEAWCEAVVQRLPVYVDPADTPWAVPLAAENQTLGRRFAVVAFRWLTAADL